MRDRAGKKVRRYLTEVVPGAATSARDRISDSSYEQHGIAAGADGTLYALEPDFGLSELTPSTRDCGGGGGGNGGGKGKNK